MSPHNLRLKAFTKLSGEDAESIIRLTRTARREVKPRRDLVREGDSLNALYVIIDGWACRYKALPDGRRRIVNFLIPGDLVDVNFHVLREMDHSVGAITAMEVAEIGREQVEELLAHRPAVAKALWWDGLVEASIQREWTLNVGQRTALERVSHLLCEMFMRLQLVGLTDGNRCDFPLTQVDLADATGLTAVHVNRTLQELRKQGAIELQNRALIIPDMKALRDIAMYNANYLHVPEGAAGLANHA